MLDNEKIKYFAYLRKSSETDDRQALSIDNQKNEVIKMVNRDNLTIIDIICESHSAKERGKRPGFEKMIQRIEKGEANGIVLWSISRLSRNAGDTGAVIDLLDKQILLEVRTAAQVFTSNPNDKFLLSLLCSQAKLENDNKGQDVKSALRTKAEMGWYPLPALLGYKNTPDRTKGKKIIEVDSEKFPIVRRMFQMVLSQEYSASNVWKIATDEWGLRRPNGKKLSHSGWYTMLKHPFYYGEFQYNGFWYKGKHKPMITKDDFLKIQAILGAKKPSKPQRHSFPYTGLMRCKECGTIITAEHKFKKQKNGIVRHYIYYHCTAPNKNVCSQGVVSQEHIHEQMLDIARSVQIPSDFAQWALRAMEDLQINDNASKAQILANQHTMIAQYEKRIDALIDLRINKEITEEEFALKKKSLQEEKLKINIEIKEIGSREDNWRDKLEKDLNLASVLFEKLNVSKNDSAKKAILSEICSNLTLKDKKVNPRLNSSFEGIKKASKYLVQQKIVVRTSKNLLVKRKNAPSYDAFPVLLRE